MTRSYRLSRLGWLALLAVCVALGWRLVPPAAEAGRAVLAERALLDAGEALLHRLPAEDRGLLTFRLPLESLLLASLYDHHPAAAAAAAPALQWAGLLLWAALGFLLAPGAALVLPAALLLCGAAGWRFPGLGRELISCLFALNVAALLVWRAQSRTWGRSLLLALAVGASLLHRSTLAFFPPLLALWEWAAVHRFSLRCAWKHVLILCAVPWLFLAPWLSLNWSLHHRLVFFERGAADSNLVSGALGLVETMEGDVGGLTGRFGEPRGLSWAAGEAVRHPGRYAWACVERAGWVFRLHPVLFLLALAGLWLERSRPAVRCLAGLCAYFAAIHCLLTVEARYFLPLWPLLCTLAAAPAASLSFAPVRPGLWGGLAAGLTALAVSCAGYGAVVVGRYGAAAGRPADPRALERELAQHPDEAWLLHRRGREKLLRGDLAGALPDFQRAGALRPGDARYGLALVWTRQLLADRLLAEPWESVLASCGREDEETALRSRADVLAAYSQARFGRARAAQELLRRAARLHEEASFVRGRRGPREESLSRRLRAAAAGSFAREALGLPELQARPRQEWKPFVGALLALSPAGSPGSRLARAEAGWQTGDRRLFSSAVRGASAQGLSERELRRLAELCGLMDEPGAEAVFVDKLLELSPDDAGSWVARAQLAARAKDAAVFDEAVRRALSARPGYGERRRLALAFQTSGRYDEAIALLEALSRERPWDAANFNDLGVCSALRGSPDEARRAFERALELEPGLRSASSSLEVLKKARP